MTMPIGYADLQFPWQRLPETEPGPSDPKWAERGAPDARSMVEAAKVQLLCAARDAMLEEEAAENSKE